MEEDCEKLLQDEYLQSPGMDEEYSTRHMEIIRQERAVLRRRMYCDDVAVPCISSPALWFNVLIDEGRYMN